MTTSYLNPTLVIDRHNIISKEQQSIIYGLSTTEVRNEEILSQKFDQLSPFKNVQTKKKSSSTNKKIEQYQRQLHMKTNRLIGYTGNLKCTIEKFVQQGLQTLCLEINQQITSVQYDYTDTLLKHAFFAQNPNHNQIKIIKRLCKLKYDQEMTKHEMNFLKQQIPIYLASHQFEHESIAQSSLINSISGQRMRENLYQQ
ncbi:unnamed protein product [Rotaria sordida]|uniref:Uncharacterized protein n=1 Tax=Rotaria sordida TaxID=392033 RepID=A0A814ZCB6_9BILA|nr:unnamed protein product [Rotaria sordida]CAF3908576.1 unnamed protein product [Rotaria sordida]